MQVYAGNFIFQGHVKMGAGEISTYTQTNYIIPNRDSDNNKL